MTKAEFKELVENGPVILDGATGTNLQKAGMPVGVCPEQWILENPDIMIKLQEDYVAAGTNILYAPTFTANRIKLEEYGLADKLEEIRKNNRERQRKFREKSRMENNVIETLGNILE